MRALAVRLRAVIEAKYNKRDATGACKVPQDAIKALQKPVQGDSSTGGIWKAIQRALRKLESEVSAADWYWEQIKRLQRAGVVWTSLERVTPGGAKHQGWRQRTIGRATWNW